MKIHPVIHVSNLKPYHADPYDERRNVVTRPPVTMKNPTKKVVDEILADRIRRVGRPRRDLKEFLVKWRDLPEEEISWERAEDLQSATAQIAAFEQRRLTGTSTI